MFLMAEARAPCGEGSALMEDCVIRRPGRDESPARDSPHHSPRPCSQPGSRAPVAVDEVVFQTAVLPWPAVQSEGMHPVGPETEPPAALAHSAPWLPAFSVYQTPVSTNTQLPLFAIWHGGAVFDRGRRGLLYLCLCIACVRLCVLVRPSICPSGAGVIRV